MLNRLAAWVVNNYIGEYVENLNRDSVYVGLLAGAVQLDDLILKKDVFNQFGLPLQLKKGSIRKISLKIPMTRIHSEPWVITIEGVNIIVEPMKHADCDKVERKKLYQNRKQFALDTVDDMLKQSGKVKGSSGSWLVTLTSIASNILENLQLHVNDVHIRYEDTEINPACPFAVGVDIDSLIAQSTDDNWKPCFVYRDNTDMMFKLVELNKLSLYFDTNAQMIGDMTMTEIVELLQSKQSLRNGYESHDYTLFPINARAHIKRNTSEKPLKSANMPRVSIDINIEEVAVSLSNVQYKLLVYWTRELDKQDRLYRCLKWRPDVSVKESPKQWWDYAITAHLFFMSGRPRDFSLKKSVQRARDVINYYKAYCAYLNQTSSITMQEHQKKMEDELNIEDIKVLRLLAFDTVSKETKESTIKASTPVTPTPEEYKMGYLQSWMSWAVGSSEPLSPETLSEGSEEPSSDESSQERVDLEKELMDIMNKAMDSDTFYKRDRVFANLNFCLQKGSLKLLTSTEQESTIRDMLVAECHDVNIQVEARPQVGAYKFCISLGIFELQDRLTKESCFPHLILPNPKEVSYIFRRMRFGKPIGKTSTIQEVPTAELGVDPKDKIFELTLEKNPTNSSRLYRIYVKTQSIAIICNPYTVKELKDFLSVSQSGFGCQDTGQTLTDAAYKRYQNLKFHTKTELQNRWRELLQGNKVPQKNRIEIKLDIAAPKIIVPESFFDQNTTMVVFDLGYLSFQNAQTDNFNRQSPDSEDQDEEFLTPSQSPPNEPEVPEVIEIVVPQQLSTESMDESFYEKYKVVLEDMQVLIGQTHDNWKAAHSRGNSRVHLLDKFTIELLLERRLVFTTDPEWPSAKLSGTLPSLTIHADQRKIKALCTCMSQLNTLQKMRKKRKLKNVLNVSQSETDPVDFSVPSASLLNLVTEKDNEKDNEKEKQDQRKLESSVLLVSEFSVNKLSLEINSRGRPITELQVDHVKGRFVKQPREATVTLTVHSLLLVDGLQTFGKDFELLAASHKNLAMDSRSGILRGSESQVDLVPSPVASFSGLNDLRDESGTDPPQEGEALITLHIQFIASNSPNNPTNEKVGKADIQFNSLDVIANQETLTEIMSFFHTTMQEVTKFTTKGNTEPAGKDQQKHSDSRKQPNSVPKSISDMCIGMTADFHRLNILLLRLENSESGRHAKKVATVTMSNAQINARLSEKLEVAGSLEGFHIVNITAEAHRHQYILQVGKLSALPSFSSTHDMVHLYTKAAASASSTGPSAIPEITADSTGGSSYALTFQLERYLDRSSALSNSCPMLPLNDSLIYKSIANQLTNQDVMVQIRMASVCYIHSPLFLRELTDCLSDFKDYTYNVASSIKHAAKEVARGLVAKRTDSCAGGTGLEHSPHNLRKSQSQSLEMTDFFPPDLSFSEDMWVPGTVAPGTEEAEMHITIDMRIDTPIVFLPRKQTSSEVLMACLGEISIENMMANKREIKDVKDQINIRVDKMSLYAVNLSTFNIYERVFNWRGLDIEQLFNDEMFLKCNPVLYDTNLEITVHVYEVDITQLPTTDAESSTLHPQAHAQASVGEDDINSRPNSSRGSSVPHSFSSGGRSSRDVSSPPTPQQSLSISIVMTTPFKLVVSKQVYEQILETRHNLTLGSVDEDTVSFSLYSETEGDGPPVPGISVLKLDSSGESDVGKVTRTASCDSSHSAKTVPSSLPMEARFEVPLFSIRMNGDFGPDSQNGLVDLCLQDLILVYHRAVNHVSSFDLSLKSLTMEDLLQEKDSKHRYLMLSSQKEEAELKDENIGSSLSTSCPDCTIMVPKPRMPGSLPSSFHEENVFTTHSKKNTSTNTRRKMTRKEQNRRCSVCKAFKFPSNFFEAKRSAEMTAESCFRRASFGPSRMFVSDGCYPCTPPPSPMGSFEDLSSDGPLVHIHIVLVDNKCPQFHTVYKKINRSIDIEFSSLDTTINLQTWVVLLDFLGLGAKFKEVGAQSPRYPSASNNSSLDTEDSLIPSEQVINSEIRMNIESFTLILNKPEYELARANVSKFQADVSLRDGNTHLSGQLGSVSLLDQSPYGYLFREKFISVGDQAFTFDIFKYGIEDPVMQRSYDLRITLHMSTVQYTYTDRFQSEMSEFCMHFLQLHDTLGRFRAASIGKKITPGMMRAARIQLNIEADSPVIMFPHSYKTTDLLVAELGQLKVINRFLLNGSAGTIKARQNKPVDVTSEGPSYTDHFERQTGGSDYAPMTQSLFEQSCPSQSAPASVDIEVDSMSQSIYGSLEHDIREGELVAPSMTESKSSEIFDPTENASSDIMLAPLECVSPGNFSVLDHRFPVESSKDTLSPVIGTKLCKKLSAPLLAQEKKLLNPFQLSVQQSMAFTRQDPSTHICLLDVMSVTLTDMDFYSAELRKTGSGPDGPIYNVEREPGKILKDKCELLLQVERNLDQRISHSAPNIHMTGKLSSVHAFITLKQFKLLRGILSHNLGEKLPEFQRPVMTYLKDPKNEQLPSDVLWTNMLMEIDLRNITVELLFDRKNGSDNPLARFDFIHSNLLVKIRSNGTKDVDLVSDEIRAVDTRYKNMSTGKAPSVFSNILQPSKEADGTSKLQMELYFQFTNQVTLFTVLLNNMRLMCIFDWLLAVNNFLTTPIDDPFSDSKSQVPINEEDERKLREPSQMPLRRPHSPLNISQGIVTRRRPAIEQVEVPFELKVNVRNTQFVVVADMSTWDTEAAILKCTAVLRYRPKAQDLPLSCSLQSLEVFSCFLMEEEETALSIIDPTSVTIEMNANPLPDRGSSHVTGLLDASAVEHPLVLEVTMNQLNIRLSYNDMKMFMAVFDSLPQQAINARTLQNLHFKFPESVTCTATSPEVLPFGESSVDAPMLSPKKMMAIPGSPLNRSSPPDTYISVRRFSETHSQGPLTLTGVEVKAGSICICLIDDCKDADVPLAEISFNQLDLQQHLLPKKAGRGVFKLVGDYYNRKLSGWEPFIENWKCNASWEFTEGLEEKLELKVESIECLNINLTSAFIDQYTKTRVKWTEDYYKNAEENKISAKDIVSVTKQTVAKKFGLQKRIPFVPFVIRNNTGLPFHFLTMTTTPACVSGVDTKQKRFEKPDDSYIMATEWKQVEPNEEIPFFFQRREKIRHKETHELRVNQLVGKAEGWQKMSAVTVDKVGVYFRDAQLDEKVIRSQVSFEPLKQGVLNFSTTYRAGDLPSPAGGRRGSGDTQHNEKAVRRQAALRQQVARFVFDVTQEGSARKVITVRSALTIVNKLHMPVTISMYLFGGLQESLMKHTTILEPNEQSPVPILYTSSSLCVRPCDMNVEECCEPLYWDKVRKIDEISDYHRVCNPKPPHTESFRFCVSVRRGKYPEDVKDYSIPAHTITLQPPVTLCNLLPIEMAYYFKNTSMEGQVEAGQHASLYQADLSQHLELGIQLENFRECHELVIPPGTTNYKARFELYDSDKRMLALTVRIIARKGGAFKNEFVLLISAPYWLVNKSGIPLIFKQELTRNEAAGQSEDHERAKSVTPLLFSFTDKESPNRCSMRAGKMTMPNENIFPQWCSRFSLDSGIGTRQVHISPKDTNSPDWVFTIGIEVKQGRGMYRDTNIVTFAPRYCIDNQSNFKLSIAQRHFTKEETALSNSERFLAAHPKSSMPFHWPRVDFDALLCVKVIDEEQQYHWSGGFRIDKVDSFHINIRDVHGNSLLLKVEVILIGPTLHVLFYNSDDMPPPFRIDNYSLIPIEYYQSSVKEVVLRQYIKPMTSLPYAWDEPILEPYITLGISGGTSATYNMNKPGDGEQLCYQNFIFLAATSTFNGDENMKTTSGSHGSSEELVLDSISSRIVFKRKELGKRSQLWRMTGEGMLENEGSAPPQEPGKVARNVLGLVLDTSDIAPQPGKCVPLILRKPDERRRATQLWKFTDDGMLMCANGAMCVQAVDVTVGLADDSIALLGPGPPKICEKIPCHMQISRQKQRPGSGCLSVMVLMDGPVRVLHISDIQKTLKHLWYGPGLRPGGRPNLVHYLLRCGHHGNVLCAQRDIPGHMQHSSVTDPALDDWHVIDPLDSPTEFKRNLGQEQKHKQKITLQGVINLPRGVGISLVNRVPEELVYILLKNIDIRCCSKEGTLNTECSIGNVQIDNQLFSAQQPVLLSIAPSKTDMPDNTPALHMTFYKNPSQWNVEIFKHLIISVRKVKLHLEEELLLKLLHFTGTHETDEDSQFMETTSGSQRPVLQAAASPPQNKRYFFALLRLNTRRISLSMLTSPNLSPDLKVIKNKMSFHGISFEDATVDLGSYYRQHVFETSTFLINEIKSHYTEELKGQAAKILGSIDFLGNPLGLFNDFTEGISGLIKDGNFGGLLKNVTHGVSNSTAKVTSSLSDGLTIVTMDEKYSKKRTQIMSEHTTGHSSGHLKAGCKSLVFGLVGGLTSVVNQTYEGTRDDGLGGFITGLSKGLVGTVIKPVAGVLDFATAAAAAARETSRRSHKIQVRVREPRCCHGLGGLLPHYNLNHAKQQMNIHLLNGNQLDELFIAWEQVRKEINKRVCALITNQKVYFLMGDKGTEQQIVDYQIYLRDIQFCMPVSKNECYYVKFVKKYSTKSPPYIRCDNFLIAQRVSQQILYALGLYQELQQTLPAETLVMPDFVDQ